VSRVKRGKKDYISVNCQWCQNTWTETIDVMQSEKVTTLSF
jgi:hypothetical protein